MILKEKILDLISEKQEGDYWDFKESWHTDNAELLHDIICLANNLTDNDGYLIFGVKDKTYEIVGAENNPDRKNQQKVIDFLGRKKFLGGIRPNIILKTFEFKKHEVDVLIVKNTNQTPYHLTENYKSSEKGKTVRANHIYTRVRDTNTPINESADVSNVEYLWKKRFNLTVSPIIRMFEEMKNIEKWQKNCIGEDTFYYHKINPEFTVSLGGEKEDYEIHKFYNSLMVNESSFCGEISVRHFGTEVFSAIYMCLDGSRYITPVPEADYLCLDGNPTHSYEYSYFIKNSNEEILQNFLLESSYSKCNAMYAKENLDRFVLYFGNEKEKEEFENIVLENKHTILSEIEKLKEQINVFVTTNDSEKELIKLRIATGKIFKKWQQPTGFQNINLQ